MSIKQVLLIESAVTFEGFGDLKMYLKQLSSAVLSKVVLLN